MVRQQWNPLINHPGHSTLFYVNWKAKSSWDKFCCKCISTNSNFWESLRKCPVDGMGKLTAGEADSGCICIAGCNHPNNVKQSTIQASVHYQFFIMTSKRWGFVFSNASSAFKSSTCFLNPSISLWYSRHLASNCSGIGLDATCADVGESSGLSQKWSRSVRHFLPVWK